MALADVRKAPASGSGGGSANLGGAALKVIKTERIDGVTDHILGTLLFDSVGRKAGDEVKVYLLKSTAAKVDDNLKRGQGSAKDSVLILENVMNKFGDDGAVVARWITTAKSGLKAQDESAGHDKRSVERVFVAPPTIGFVNPNREEGEPEYLFFNVTDKQRSYSGHVLTREQVLGKLAKINDPASVRVQSTAIAPDSAEKAESVEQALKLIEGTFNNANAVAYVRVHDDKGDVEVAMLRKRYKDTIEETMTNLRDNGIFRNIPNEALDAGVQSGGFVLECLVGIDVPYLGDSRARIVKHLSENAERTLNDFEMVYGTEGQDMMADAIITLMPTIKGDGNFFAHDPVRLSLKKFNAKYLPTQLFDLPEPEPQAEATQDATSAAAPQEAGGDAGGDDDLVLNANDYDFVEPTDSELEDLPGAATARSRMNS